MKRFERNPLIIDAVQWLGDNEAEVKELAGDMFQSVHQCSNVPPVCETCSGNPDITAELTIKGIDTEDEDQDDYTLGVESGYWIIRLPDGRLSCLPDSTLQFNYQEVVP